MDIYIILKAFFRFVWVLFNNLYCIAAYVLCCLILRPLLWYEMTHQLYWKIEGVLFRWLLVLVSEWAWSAGYTIAEVGDDVSDIVSENAVVMSNHQSTADVPTLFYSFTNKADVANNIYWIMDDLFKYTNFGLVSQCHGDFFILQGKDTRQLQLERLKDHINKVYIPRKRQWICLFPEGGFLHKRRVTSQNYAKKNAYPVLEHVTLPRIGAMQIILKELAPQSQNCISNGICSGGVNPGMKSHSPLKWIIDVTIGYPSGKPLDLLQIILGLRPPCKTMLHFRKYPVNQVPQDDEQLLKWMYKRFVEKEELLNQFYSTGKFPVKSDKDNANTNGHVVEKPLEIKLCCSYLALLHLIYAVIMWCHYKWLSHLCSYFF